MSDDLHQTSSGKRLDVISWDEFFMSVAIAAQRRSKDPNTQVGACIANTNHRILSVGYNGTPSALNDDFFPWGTSDDPLQDKHNYVVHAEANAVLNYRGSLKDLEGSRSMSRCSRAMTAPRFWLRWAWARLSTWTTSTPTPMTAVSAAAFSTPVASATARLSSMFTSAPRGGLGSSAWQRQLAAKAAKRAPSQIDYS